jgi:hypothetical protein
MEIFSLSHFAFQQSKNSSANNMAQHNGYERVGKARKEFSRTSPIGPEITI